MNKELKVQNTNSDSKPYEKPTLVNLGGAVDLTEGPYWPRYWADWNGGYWTTITAR